MQDCRQQEEVTGKPVRSARRGRSVKCVPRRVSLSCLLLTLQVINSDADACATKECKS
jgi:hypothetical protein